MPLFVLIAGCIGFIVSLSFMYGTSFGIPGIRKFDPEFKLLDMRFRYEATDVYTTFERIGTSGIQAYKHYLITDFCFIASFLIVMIGISLKLAPSPMIRNTLIGFATARALLDIFENILLILMLEQYPTQKLMIASFCSWLTTLKFVALYSWMALLVIVVIKSIKL